MLTLSLGLLLLIIGAELVANGVKQVSKLFGFFGTSFGFVLVAISSSLPGLSMSLFSAFETPELIMYLVVTNFIFQMTFFLGMIGAVKKTICFVNLGVNFKYLLLMSIIVFIASLDGIVDGFEGSVILIIYFSRLVLMKVRRQTLFENPLRFLSDSLGGLMMLLAGGIMILIGTRGAIEGAISFVEPFTPLIGVVGILLAVITLFPTFSFSLIASSKGKCNEAISNLIESSFFMLAVPIGFASLLFPIPVNSQFFAFCMGVSFLALLLFHNGCFSKWKAFIIGSAGIPFVLFMKSILS